jgi:glycosyltransferase involved in cell wall biosynthesis
MELRPSSSPKPRPRDDSTSAVYLAFNQPNLSSQSTAEQVASRPNLDIVIPLFNEEAIVDQLHRRVVAVCRSLDLSWRIIYVDDGSSDRTVPLLKQLLRHDERVEILSLVRNFGQPAAILAGMTHADASAIVLMDGDLQDPPELIPELISAWQQGHSVVIAQRPERRESSWLRGLAFKSFHRLFRRLSELEIPENCGTFCLLSRSVAAEIVKLPEAHRFFPGLRAWVGGKPKLISYQRPARAAGEPKQTFSRLVRYAGDGILGFSRKPTSLLIKSGLSLLLLAALGGAVAIGCWSLGLSGAAPCAIVSGFLGLAGLQLASCGFLGDLLLRVQEQVKQRPSYLIGEHYCSVENEQEHRRAA